MTTLDYCESYKQSCKRRSHRLNNKSNDKDKNFTNFKRRENKRIITTRYKKDRESKFLDCHNEDFINDSSLEQKKIYMSEQYGFSVNSSEGYAEFTSLEMSQILDSMIYILDNTNFNKVKYQEC
jgi:hypothetical protein